MVSASAQMKRLCLLLLSTTKTALAGNNYYHDCFDQWQDLQKAINSLPTGIPTGETPVLHLCPKKVIDVPQALHIQERSLRLQCGDGQEEETNCVLQSFEAKDDGTMHRLLEIVGGVSANGQHATNTVELVGITLRGGEWYVDPSMEAQADDDEQLLLGGGAILARGVHLIVTRCHFQDNASTLGGGAISMVDDNRPVVLVVTQSQFQDNTSLDYDCHSISWKQSNANSMALVTALESSRQRRLNDVAWMDQWDDPAQAADALSNYRPQAGATLCF